MTTLIANADAYILSSSPNNNYGSGWYIPVLGYTSYQTRALVQFDITSIDVGEISSATLRLYLFAVPSGGSTGTHKAKRITSSWTENGVTWNNQPSATTTNEASVYVTNADAGSWIEFDVTNLVKDQSGDTLGILIKDDTESFPTTNEFDYVSTEHSTLGPPELVITTNRFYVKIGGNDTNDGLSWANAWATVNKAATTVADGSIVHIGFGTYSAEPANNDIAPVNAGTVGIKYLPETATTGGGTGSVIVEVN